MSKRKGRLTRHDTRKIIEETAADYLAKARDEASTLTGKFYVLAMNQTPSIRVGAKRLGDFTDTIMRVIEDYTETAKTKGAEEADRQLNDAIRKITQRGRRRP